MLIEQALVNLLENAISHTPPDAAIRAIATCEEGAIVLAIEDEGRGIAKQDLARVFDKFYRGHSDRRAGSGVGLGLSVSRGLVESFGGEVRAISPASGDKGTRMEVRLPSHAAMEQVE